VVVTDAPWSVSSTDLRRDFHWLPIRQRIVYKQCLMTYKVIPKSVHIGQPNYLNELLQPYQPVRTLRSSTSALLVIPFVRSDFAFFNMSFTSGVVPTSLKIAKVIPVYKKGDRCLIGNYRPISLLSVFDKILEKLMYTRLINYLNVNNILYDYQFGFRRYHSTTLALIDVVDQIYQHLDNRDMVLGIYLDLQKAFDTVNHNILLAKLANFGIRGVVYNWFKDYLNDRKQYVCISGTKSECGKITWGPSRICTWTTFVFVIC